MENTNKEKVIMEAKLEAPVNKEQNVIKLSINEEQASQNIAKSLIQDFITLITIAGLKAVFANFPDKKQFMLDLLDAWKKRNSIQLAEETKVFHESILNAFKSESSVDEETTKKMNRQIDSFNKTRDKAVSIAESAAKSIIDSIVDDGNKEEQK